MITIVDYDSGNLRSVTKALESLGAEILVTSSPSDIERAESLIVPGVGAFGDAMDKLHGRRLVAPIRRHAHSGKPFLGICVGLQLMFEGSEEAPGVEGLGLLPGQVRRFPSAPGRKIPHMGWNQIIPANHPDSLGLLGGISNDAPPYVYFVHSYYAEPANPAHVMARTNYDGFDFCAIAGTGNMAGVQFHPEKSQAAGLRLLSDFATKAPSVLNA